MSYYPASSFPQNHGQTQLFFSIWSAGFFREGGGFEAGGGSPFEREGSPVGGLSQPSTPTKISKIIFTFGDEQHERKFK